VPTASSEDEGLASRQVGNTFVYLGTVALTQLASFVLLPILTRFLVPAAFAQYAVALAVGGLVGMFGSSWIRNVGFRFYFDARAEHATRAFYLGQALLQAVTVLAAFAMATPWASAGAHPLVSLPTLGALATMVLTSDLQALTVSFLRAEQRAGRFAVAESGAALVRVLGTTAGLVAGFRSPAFLFLAASAASLIGASLAVTSLWPRLEGPLGLDLPGLKRVARQAPAALPFSVGVWLNTLFDRLILTWLSTATVVGVYSAGQSVGNRAMAGIVQAVFMMAWPDVLHAWTNGGTAAARTSVRRYIAIFLMLTVGPVVALVVYADSLALLLGEAYRGSVDVISLIALATWVGGLGDTFNRHFELTKRFGLLSGWTLAGAVLNVGLTFLLVPRFLGIGAAAATLASQVLVTAVYIGLRDRELVSFPWGDAARAAVAAAASLAVSLPAFGLSLAGLAMFAATYLLLVGGYGLRRLRRRRVMPGAPAA